MRRKIASDLWKSNMHPDVTVGSEGKADIYTLTDAIRVQVKRSNGNKASERREASIVSQAFMLMREKKSPVFFGKLSAVQYHLCMFRR